MEHNMIKIAFLHIATNKYTIFIDPLINSIEKNFLPEVKKDYYVFTDDMDLKTSCPINKIEIEPKGFPGDTYYRYHHFISIKDKLKDYDYIYYLDADMRVVDYVGEEVLTDLLGVQHPGFCIEGNKQGTPENRQKDSTAYLPTKDVVQYCIQ